MIKNIKYISIEQYTEKINRDVKKKVTLDTVTDWYKSGYIIGAVEDKDGDIIVPEETNRPYTHRSRKKKTNIFRSVLNGINKGFEVNGPLYGYTEEMFCESIIKPLKEKDLVNVIRVQKRKYVYYRKTPRLENLKQYQLMKLLEAIKPIIIVNAN